MATTDLQSWLKKAASNTDLPNPAAIITTAGSQLPAPVNTGYTVAEQQVLDESPELKSIIQGGQTLTAGITQFGVEWDKAKKEGWIEQIKNASYLIPGPDGKPVNVLELQPPPIDPSLIPEDPGLAQEQLNKHNTAWEKEQGYPEFRAAALKYYEEVLELPDGWQYIPSIRRAMDQSEANALAVLVNTRLQEERNNLADIDSELTVEDVVQQVVGSNQNGYLQQVLAPVLANHRGAIAAARGRQKKEAHTQHQLTAYKSLSDQIVNAGSDDEAHKKLEENIKHWLELKANMEAQGFVTEAALIEDTMAQELWESVATAWAGDNIDGDTIEERRERVDEMTSFLVLKEDVLKSLKYFEANGRWHFRSAAAHETRLRTLGEVDRAKVGILGEITENALAAYATSGKFSTISDSTIAQLVETQKLEAAITPSQFMKMADELVNMALPGINKDRKARGLDPINKDNNHHMILLKGKAIRILEGRLKEKKDQQRGDISNIKIINDSNRTAAVDETDASMASIYRKYATLKRDEPSYEAEKEKLDNQLKALIEGQYTSHSLIPGEPASSYYIFDEGTRKRKLAYLEQMPIILPVLIQYQNQFKTATTDKFDSLKNMIPHPDSAKEHPGMLKEFTLAIQGAQERLNSSDIRAELERLPTAEQKELYIQEKYQKEEDWVQAQLERMRTGLEGTKKDYQEKPVEPKGFKAEETRAKEEINALANAALEAAGLSPTGNNRRKVLELLVALQSRNEKYTGKGSSEGSHIWEIDWDATRNGAVGWLLNEGHGGWGIDGDHYQANPDQPGVLQNTKFRWWWWDEGVEDAAHPDWMQNERSVIDMRSEARVSTALQKSVAREVIKKIGLRFSSLGKRDENEVIKFDTQLIRTLQGAGTDIYLSDFPIGTEEDRNNMEEWEWRYIWENSQTPVKDGGLGRAEREIYRYDPNDVPGSSRRYKLWRERQEEMQPGQRSLLIRSGYHRNQEGLEDTYPGGWPSEGVTQDNAAVKNFIQSLHYPQPIKGK